MSSSFMGVVSPGGRNPGTQETLLEKAKVSSGWGYNQLGA